MNLRITAVPMTLKNQQYVMCPTGEGATYQAEAVYAETPEVAVEYVRKTYAIGNFGEDDLPHDMNIRLAEGAELPWHQGNVWIVTSDAGNHMTTITGSSRADIEKDYAFLLEGKPFTVREATPAEAEESVRTDTLLRDQEDEEQFNYGFNVLYKEQMEGTP